MNFKKYRYSFQKADPLLFQIRKQTLLNKQDL